MLCLGKPWLVLVPISMLCQLSLGPISNHSQSTVGVDSLSRFSRTHHWTKQWIQQQFPLHMHPKMMLWLEHLPKQNLKIGFEYLELIELIVWQFAIHFEQPQSAWNL